MQHSQPADHRGVWRQEENMTRLNRIAMSTVAALCIAAAPALAKTTFNAHLSGSDQVPVRTTHATGQVQFWVNKDVTEIQFRVNVSNIENVTAAQIQVGAPGTTGPVVAMLYGPAPAGAGKQSGTLAAGKITASSLTGEFAGRPLSEFVAAMEAGRLYINVLTDDGVPGSDSKSGDFSSGEIRGQIL